MQQMAAVIKKYLKRRNPVAPKAAMLQKHILT